MKVILDHTQNLTLEDIMAVGLGEATAELAASTRALLVERRAQIETSITEQEFPAYGFNQIGRAHV